MVVLTSAVAGSSMPSHSLRRGFRHWKYPHQGGPTLGKVDPGRFLPGSTINSVRGACTCARDRNYIPILTCNKKLNLIFEKNNGAKRNGSGRLCDQALHQVGVEVWICVFSASYVSIKFTVCRHPSQPYNRPMPKDWMLGCWL